MSDITINVKAPSVNVNATPQSNVIAPKMQMIRGGSVTVDDELSLTSENPVQNKVITSALNEKAPVIINTASGDIASFSDGADSMPIKSLVANIEPVQDLNGYDSPWPAGGGKNLFNADTWTLGGQTAWVKNSDNNYTFAKNGTGNADRISNRGSLRVPAGNYFLSFKASEKSASNISIRLRVNDEYESGIVLSYSDGYYYKALTVPEGTTGIQIYYANNSTAVGTSITVTDVQIESGSSRTDYAPYSNICPISGHTEMTVQRAGKNMLPVSRNEATVSGVTFTWDDAGILHCSGTLSAATRYDLLDGDSFTLFPGTYKLSGKDFANTSGSVSLQLRTNISTGASSIATLVEANGSLIFTVTESTDVYPVVYLSATAAPVNSFTFSPMLTSEAADITYEPYKEITSLAINWQTEAGTVYGGQLAINEDGSCDLTVADANIASYNGETLPSTWISDRDVYAEGTTPTIGAQVVYKLATPTVYHLPSVTMLKTLLGTNNIWADTGDVAVEYCTDTKLYIDNLIASLSS